MLTLQIAGGVALGIIAVCLSEVLWAVLGALIQFAASVAAGAAALWFLGSVFHFW
jgi:hypothetical protein